MLGNLLGDLQTAAVLEIGRHAGRAKAVTADLRANAGILLPPTHYAIHVGLAHRLFRQHVRLAGTFHNHG